MAVSSVTAFFWKNHVVIYMMELYYYEKYEYSQTIINTITNLKINNKFIFKNIHDNTDSARDLIEIRGNETVLCMVTVDVSMKEAKDIRKYLVSHFL